MTKPTITDNYDKDNDIMYVTFGTGEPSFAVEVDDVVILEIGAFSNLFTGFRILNYSKNNESELLENTKKAILKELESHYVHSAKATKKIEKSVRHFAFA